jgi:hypothetical protein
LRQSAASPVSASLPPSQLLGHLVAQKATEARARLGELLCGLGRGGNPLEEVIEESEQGGGRGQLRTRRLHVALQVHDLDLLSIPPQAEAVAVGVDEVGQRLELPPLASVVGVFEAARVGALARRLHLNESDERVVAGDGKVGPGSEISQRGLPHRCDGRGGQSAEESELADEGIQRGA